jgi:hypothetical protein
MRDADAVVAAVLSRVDDLEDVGMACASPNKGPSRLAVGECSTLLALASLSLTHTPTHTHML